MSIDSLEPFGVEGVEMPMTAERVWRAVNGQAATDGGRMGESEADASGAGASGADGTDPDAGGDTGGGA